MIFLSAGHRKAHRPSIALLVVLVIALLAQISVAQKLTEAPDSRTTDAATTADPATTERTTAAETTAASTAETTAETTARTTAETTAKTTAETTAETTSETTAKTTAATTGFTATTSESSTSASTTDSTTSTTQSSGLVPVVTVPPVGDAPYMQKSDTPEGTVFIAVGAVLGFVGLAILAWRGLVAWSVNRSVRRAALMHSSETKGLLRTRKKRSTVHTQASMPAVSLDKLSSNKRGSHANPRSSKVPSSSSGLFFSPTAGAHTSGNRGSSYLPAGYYAAGSSAAGSHPSMHFSSSDLPGLGPQSQGYVRTRSGPSPPGTPTYEPSPHHAARQSYVGGSTSSLNLSSPPPQGRTPSAYLEDLFENHAPQQQNRNSRR
ncbi:predicted protein [Aspergillus terreus NIH2624]|uniref:Mid2 domain-containing protein n=1 Tax=Aspergillus terreus (strain NIH 2624 / FGSC A1156) TaxID=341663 RepID=Q0CPT0_ASPTN|nr:uncharacterized protein ATEG_04304 [Aspergillus terreus NIH2624]EAU34751.1 predicted protein [Aspergillus terreus NIH2624]